jgi:hypothetical protein
MEPPSTGRLERTSTYDQSVYPSPPFKRGRMALQDHQYHVADVFFLSRREV